MQALSLPVSATLAPKPRGAATPTARTRPRAAGKSASADRSESAHGQWQHRELRAASSYQELGASSETERCRGPRTLEAAPRTEASEAEGRTPAIAPQRRAGDLSLKARPACATTG